MTRKNNNLLVFFISSVFLLLVSLAVSCASASQLATKITFNAPPENIYQIGDVQISVSLSNYDLAYTPGEPPSTGKGVLIYYLDAVAPVAKGVPALTAPGTFATTKLTAYTWHNVGSGSHIVSAELANEDFTPLDPPVVSTMQIVVVPEPGDPRIVILTPLDGVKLKPGDIPVSVEVNNLSLVKNTGQTPVSGEGHIIYFLDADPLTDPGKPATTDPGTYAASESTSYTWQNVPAGVHKLSVELVNDDDTPLSPAVTAAITITVSN